MSTLANEGIFRPQMDRCHTSCGTNSWGPARDDKNSGQIYMMKMGGQIGGTHGRTRKIKF